MVSLSETIFSRSSIEVPNKELLDRALLDSPMVKYYPTINSQEALQSVERGDKPERVYDELILSLSSLLYQQYSDQATISIRGGGICVGIESINLLDKKSEFGDKIKGISDLVTTGTETWQSPQHIKVAGAPRQRSEMGHGYVGLYAHVWTQRIRGIVPLEFQSQIFPVITVRAGKYGEPTDFYILDYISDDKLT